MTRHSASVHFRVNVDGSSVPVRALRTMVSSFLADRGVEEAHVRAIVLAFSEALDNAVEHGMNGASGVIDMRLRYAPTFIVLSLSDEGSDRSPIGAPVDPGEDADRGRGFQLMNKLMDCVRVRPRPHGGTRVSMLKRLDAGAAPS